MKKLDDNNIDEIMFQLLEGEITGQERNVLLEAIKADPAYSRLWETWQQTIIQPNGDVPEFNSESLKKKRRFVVHINLRYAAAAAIVLALSIGIYMMNSGKVDDAFTDVKPKVKTPPIVAPKPPKAEAIAPYVIESDTNMSNSEKMRYMTHENHSKNIDKSSDYKSVLMKSTDDSDANTQIAQNPVKPQLEIPKPVEHPIFEEKILPKQVQDDIIMVSIENDQDTKYTDNTANVQNKSFFKRLIGSSKIKIENDSNTLTNRKIVIENKKYQIIAGF